MLDVSNGRLNGLTTLELPLLPFVHRFDAASVHHLNTGIGGWPRAVGIHPAVAQIHEGLFDFAARRLDQVLALADLCCQGVPVSGWPRAIRIADKAFGPHHSPRPPRQALLVRDRQTHLDAELVPVSRLAFADAFRFRCMQCVELVLVLGLLDTDTMALGHPVRALQ